MASWRSLSYPHRLFAWLVAYSLLLVGCFTAFQYLREKEYKAGNLDSRLQLVNTYILTELAEGLDIHDIDLREFGEPEGLRVSLISAQGDVLYDNTLDHAPTGNHSDRDEIRDAMRHGAGFTVRRHSESTGQTYFYSATRGDNGLVVRTAVPYDVSLGILLDADKTFMWVTAAITLAFCTLGFFAARRLGLHISRLSRFARDVEQGCRISDTEPFPHDELGDISNRIVRLYARLQQVSADRDRRHREALHQQQEKERIKKQLTNNINHELKTPVAAIRVCLETLCAHHDLSEYKRREFLERGLANADRLGNLLSDVALITRMDDGSALIAKTPLDLAQLIRETAEQERPAAEAAGMEVVLTGLPPELTAEGNASLLTSVFRNLVCNAVSYSGGSEVEIALIHADERMVTLSVSDDGCGVPEEHLPYLFERFYRVDKGRSRASGGTGLGLAIVRNAVAQHGGGVTVRNRRGGGLEFTVTLARKQDAHPRA